MLRPTCDASVHLGGEETLGVDSWQAQHFSQGIHDRGSCTGTGKGQPFCTTGTGTGHPSWPGPGGLSPWGGPGGEGGPGGHAAPPLLRLMLATLLHV